MAHEQLVLPGVQEQNTKTADVSPEAIAAVDEADKRFYKLKLEHGGQLALDRTPGLEADLRRKAAAIVEDRVRPHSVEEIIEPAIEPVVAPTFKPRETEARRIGQDVAEFHREAGKVAMDWYREHLRSQRKGAAKSTAQPAQPIATPAASGGNEPFEPIMVEGPKTFPEIEKPDAFQRLREAITSREPKPLVKELLSKPELAPETALEVDGYTFLFSKVTGTPHERAKAVAYVIDNEGTIHPRFFFKSNSSGMWRSAPETINGWYHKGHVSRDGGYTQLTKLAEEIDAHLEHIESVRDNKALPFSLTAMFDKSRIGQQGEGIEVFKREVRALRLDIREEAHLYDTYDPGHGFLETAETVRKRLEEMELPEGFEPDFTQPPERQMDVFNPLSGEAKVRVYKATHDGHPIEWHVAEDAKGRVWLDRVQLEDAGVSSFGTPKRVILAGALNAKPFDYMEQLKNMEQGEDYLPFDGEYADLSPTLNRMPWVKRYRAATSKTEYVTQETVFAPDTHRTVTKITEGPDPLRPSQTHPARGTNLEPETSNENATKKPRSKEARRRRGKIGLLLLGLAGIVLAADQIEKNGKDDPRASVTTAEATGQTTTSITVTSGGSSTQITGRGAELPKASPAPVIEARGSTTVDQNAPVTSPKAGGTRQTTTSAPAAAPRENAGTARQQPEQKIVISRGGNLFNALQDIALGSHGRVADRNMAVNNAIMRSLDEIARVNGFASKESLNRIPAGQQFIIPETVIEALRAAANR